MSDDPTIPPAAPAAAMEPHRARGPAVGAIDLVIRYEAAVHGAALDYYSALKAELNRLHTEAGGTGVRLGLARVQADAHGAPTGRISIPVRPLNPADPATVMNEMVRALRAGDALPGVVDVRPRAA
jgi:hypothetical protein